MNNYGGYANYTEWKNCNPDGYWAYINAKYEQWQKGSEEMMTDEDYLALKENLDIIEDEVSPFGSMVGRYLSGTDTLWDKKCQEIADKGVEHPLYDLFSRNIDGNTSQKDSKKIARINAGLNPDIWIVRLWKWFKKKVLRR